MFEFACACKQGCNSAIIFEPLPKPVSIFKLPMSMIIQFCGLSGSGKSTLAKMIQQALHSDGLPVEVLDGDEFRTSLCRDLGFSKEDRHQNILRMAFVAGKLSKHGVIALISAIN